MEFQKSQNFIKVQNRFYSMAKEWKAKSMEGTKIEDAERKCPECGGDDFEFRGDEMYCKKCGLVID